MFPTMNFLTIALTCVTYKVLRISAEKFVINDPSLPNDPFLTVWNAPSEKCLKQHGVFLNLTAFGIVVNHEHQFIGDFMTIFYHLGKFPFFLHDGRAVYGGLPQVRNSSYCDSGRSDARPRDQVGQSIEP
jgi:hypothetical protein